MAVLSFLIQPIISNKSRLGQNKNRGQQMYWMDVMDGVMFMYE